MMKNVKNTAISTFVSRPMSRKEISFFFKYIYIYYVIMMTKFAKLITTKSHHQHYSVILFLSLLFSLALPFSHLISPSQASFSSACVYGWLIAFKWNTYVPYTYISLWYPNTYIHSFIRSFIHSFVQFIYLSMHPFIYLLIHCFVALPLHL